MNDGVDDILYVIIVIFFVSTLSSYLSKRAGFTVSSIISALSVLLSIGIGTMPVGNYGLILFFGLIVFPSVSCLGFRFGRTIAKMRLS
jgi:hypothetical protein